MKLRDLFQRKTSTISEDKDLQEIKMAPTGLMGLAKNIDFKVGMEFELYFPAVEGGEEPDYDADRAVEGIQDVISFFNDGHHNSRANIKQLATKMRKEFEGWTITEFDSQATKKVYKKLFQILEPGDVEEILYSEEPNPESKDVKKELQAVLKVIDDHAEDNEKTKRYYQQAYDEAYDDFLEESGTDLQAEWFSSNNIYMMTDVVDNYNIKWPVWKDAGKRPVELSTVADSFQKFIGRQVNFSDTYHGAKREPGKYVVEPDDSLLRHGKDPADRGIELISPPLSMADMFQDLDKVRAWALGSGCYTNSSTGLHINVSIPGITDNIENIDYVKLAIMLGDEYILRQFNRIGNDYAASAIENVRDNVRTKPSSAEEVLDIMKSGLDSVASKIIHDVKTNKYTSINVKPTGYIEFRSPGGNWLERNINEIQQTVYRFAVALDAATDPQKYRQEYQKKLYMTLTNQEWGGGQETGKTRWQTVKDPHGGTQRLEPRQSDDLLKIFSAYAAGELPQTDLKNLVKNAQIQRLSKREYDLSKTTNNKSWWWKVTRPGYSLGIEVVASSKDGAIARARAETGSKWDNVELQAEPLRPYVQATPNDR